ncbi:DHH family phosphoesterase [bacterium]|nr:DHH family phosphoesterase [bacterium]
MEIKNLKKVAKRILSAIKSKERIILYSDADLDGTVSLLILEETIKNLGGRISTIYFPDRNIEGYGLTQESLKVFQNQAPGLLILTDCGIGNFQEIEMARKIGFEVIVIDHHEILNHLPSASIIVDPKQKGDKYPFKFMPACGLCFKLAEILLGKKMSEGLRQNFLELVALATIADMMPQIADNKIFIEQGLKTLPFSFRPGLRVFFKTFSLRKFSLREIIQKIISTLQITDTKNNLTESYILLTARNDREASKLLEILLKKSAKRQKLTRALTDEIIEKVQQGSSPIIFEGGTDFPLSLTGSVASRVCNKFKKPTFIYNTNEERTRGSVRTPQGIDSVQALTHCHSLLEIYGGHPQASGFTCKVENLEKLKQCLIKYFSSK